MIRAFVHIGISKTGTTSIQGYLQRHRELLLQEHSLLIPKTGVAGAGHHAVAVDLNDPPRSPEIRVDDLAARLGDEVRDSGADRVLVSSEWLGFSHHPERLPGLLGTGDITVIVRLRRQDEWLESMFREQFKRAGNVTDITAYADRPRIERVADFAAMLERWGAVAPPERTRVGLFPPHQGESIEASLLADADVDPAGLPDPAPPAKLALNRHSLAFLAEQRAAGAVITPSSGDSVLRALSRFSRRNPDPPEWRHHLDPSGRERFLERFSEGNRWVARRFLGRDELFPGGPSGDEPWAPYPGLDDATRGEIEAEIDRVDGRKR